LDKQWNDRESWVVGFRYMEPLGGSNTNNYAEATVRVVKDIVLSRMRSFNIVAFIEFFSTAFEKYLCARILTAASATGMFAKRQDYRYAIGTLKVSFHMYLVLFNIRVGHAVVSK